MIKVPATPAGFEAMEALISEGIHVNATLVFSPAQAQGCLEAFAKGARACKIGNPHGVISVFVSRFDRKLDGVLAKKGLPQGEVGIMNAAKIYSLIEAQNMPHVRCLFASTGVKGEGLTPDYYVTRLLYPRAINTAPLETLKAFLSSSHTQVAPLPTARQIEAFFTSLETAHIDMKEVYEALINEGLVTFHEAFKAMLDALR
jgi:transaldolase